MIDSNELFETTSRHVRDQIYDFYKINFKGFE